MKEKESKNNQKGAEKEPKKGAERELDILRRLEENPEITQVKLMEEFDLSRKQIQKIIKDLREEGLVERQGSNRSGRWIVKK
nr:helix-turn-helix domain-containing protein [Blautia sp. MSJ-9]